MSKTKKDPILEAIKSHQSILENHGAFLERHHNRIQAIEEHPSSTVNSYDYHYYPARSNWMPFAIGFAFGVAVAILLGWAI